MAQVGYGNYVEEKGPGSREPGRTEPGRTGDQRPASPDRKGMVDENHPATPGEGALPKAQPSDEVDPGVG